MPLRIQLRRWHLGSHGLALLRDWPFGDPVVAEARKGARRDLLEDRGEPSLSFRRSDRKVVEMVSAAMQERQWPS